MALFKCLFCLCSLLIANVSGVDIKFLAKEAVPNGAQPFSIGVSVNPLAKVISMIQKIADDVKQEAKDEFKIFDNFACFCKDKTNRLSKMVKHHAGQIKTTSANIALWTSETNELNSDDRKRKANHEEFSTQFDETTQRLKQENANWASIEATFSNDMLAIKQALTSLKDAKNQANAFLQVPAVAKLRKLIDIADAMGLISSPKHKAVASSFLQGSAQANPLESYSYHEGSDDIIDLVESMNDQMRVIQKTQAAEHEKAVSSHESMLESLRKKIKTNKRAIAQNGHTVSSNKKDTAEARTVLIENNEDLKDTEGVLNQITSACEARAKEYDMRFAARTEELNALTTAMACLTNAHSAAVNQAKGFIQIASSKIGTEAQAQLPVQAVVDMKSAVAEKVATKPLSFLQSDRAELSSEERKRGALDVILSEGKRVKSLMLTSLAAQFPNVIQSDWKAGNDPFQKVQHLIMNLRFRLEAEAQGEVNKHVWCKRQLEVAEHERNVQFRMAKDNSAQVERIDAHIETLKASIKYHSDKAIEIGKSLTKIYTDISQLSKQQLKAMNVQTEARDEIQNAVRILRSYYSQSAKKASNPYALVQGPAPDQTLEDYRKERRNIHNENEERADDDGKRNTERAARKKKQIGDLEGGDPSAVRSGSLGDALALMETIVADFNREIGNLRGDLDAEHRELVRSNAILSGQKKKAEEMRDLDMMDLETANVDKEQKVEDLQTATDLLDSALKELENLSPTCVDTGMSYGERVKKREIEMAALKKALCMLGETDAKFGCP